jgi:hypothetical protein
MEIRYFSIFYIKKHFLKGNLMRSMILIALLSVFTLAAQRLDTTVMIKADTSITYDTTLVVKYFKDTAILIQTDIITKVDKKVIPGKKEEIKAVPGKKEEIKVAPAKKEEIKIAPVK